MAIITPPSAAELAAELIEPSFLHRSPDGSTTAVITGRAYWEGTVTFGLTDDEGLPTRGGPSVQIGDRLRVPLSAAAPTLDAGLGPVVSSTEPGIWNLSADLAESLRRPFDTWFRAGEDGVLVRLEEVIETDMIRVAPAVLGDGVLYRVTSILAEIIETPETFRSVHFIGPWTYRWREAD